MTVNMIEDHLLMQFLKEASFDLFLADPVKFGWVLLGHYHKLPILYNIHWTVYCEPI